MTSTTHGPCRNNFQHFTSCPAANDALQDLLQSTLDLVIEPGPVCFCGLAQALGLALQVFRDGLSQATSKRIPDLLAKRRLADLLEEDFNNLVHNPMSLNVVTALECNIVIVIVIVILFWEVSKAAEESLALRVGGLHNIVLILWYLRKLFIILIFSQHHRCHRGFWSHNRSRGSLAFGESRVCNLNIVDIHLHCRDGEGADGDGGESKSKEGSSELHFECALDSELGLDIENVKWRLRGVKI
ncbi:hypothetical protein BDZ91DRAFT_69197 [Kalaharituber pfeilii]|nr:hypothetical protein BDZ91DRAFT_69197 [Kalaharituber pfeilii]